MTEEIEWKITQAFINRILKEGMIREFERLEGQREAQRHLRYQIEHRTKRMVAYAEANALVKVGK